MSAHEKRKRGPDGLALTWRIFDVFDISFGMTRINGDWRLTIDDDERRIGVVDWITPLLTTDLQYSFGDNWNDHVFDSAYILSFDNLGICTITQSL